MNRPLLRSFFLSLALLVSAVVAEAKLQLASPFTDHMVLQRDISVPVWGKAAPGSEVEVRFGNQTVSTKSDEEGKWSATLKPLAGSSTPAELSVRSGSEEITRTDVVVGEVWICSGQSNMQMGRGGVKGLQGLSEEGIRTLEIKRTVAFEEQESFSGSWKLGGPSSAVAFGFAHHLKQKTEFPVGIILACWGSSSIEAWMPSDMGGELPYFKKILEEERANTENMDRIKAALAKGKWATPDDILMRRHSNIVYNAMIAPLVPYACRGLVWYQGERNTRYITGMPEDPWFHRVAGTREYDETLKAWMLRLREGWAQEEYHFLMVMLPGFGQALPTGPNQDHSHPASHSWAWMRESQMAALELPQTAVANTIDLGDVKNIHPKDKAPIGERLALLAGKQTLGLKGMAQGPTLQKIERKQGQLIVHFENGTDLKTKDGKAPREFWVADEKGTKWYRAKAALSGETVVLSHPDLRKPHHVRYAFTGKPEVNLVNGVGLPAYPFRSDDLEP